MDAPPAGIRHQGASHRAGKTCVSWQAPCRRGRRPRAVRVGLCGAVGRFGVRVTNYPSAPKDRRCTSSPAPPPIDLRRGHREKHKAHDVRAAMGLGSSDADDASCTCWAPGRWCRARRANRRNRATTLYGVLPPSADPAVGQCGQTAWMPRRGVALGLHPTAGARQEVRTGEIAQQPHTRFGRQAPHHD